MSLHLFTSEVIHEIFYLNKTYQSIDTLHNFVQISVSLNSNFFNWIDDSQIHVFLHILDTLQQNCITFSFSNFNINKHVLRLGTSLA